MNEAKQQKKPSQHTAYTTHQRLIHSFKDTNNILRSPSGSLSVEVVSQRINPFFYFPAIITALSINYSLLLASVE